VMVELKPPPQIVFDDSQPCPSNYFRFRISPDVLISVGTRIKRAGEGMVGEAAELIAHEHSGEKLTPYARLLGDALRGDGSLFTRDDCVEAAWGVIDPILDNIAPVLEYEPGTWGPPEAELIVERDGCWHNPVLQQQPGSQL
jgi:glucose-6-phosphate 1-dehydrogenase